MKLKKLLIATLSCVMLGAIGIGFAGCETEETGEISSIPTQQQGNNNPSNNLQNGNQIPNNPANPVVSEGLEYTLSEDGTYYEVTGIGTCTDKELIIPATYNELPLTSIGNYAFQNCENLVAVSISKNIKDIGACAFYGCSGLKNLTLGNGLTSIGNSAFALCDGLTEVTIPETVVDINDFAFHSCRALSKITVHANNLKYKSLDGNLYSKDGARLIQYAIGKKDENFLVPSSVIEIVQTAFRYCYNMVEFKVDVNNKKYKAIDGNLYCYYEGGAELIQYALGKKEQLYVIPNDISEIWIGEAFYGCLNVKEIVIPANVSTIRDKAFGFCDNLVSITYGGTIAEWKEAIRWGAFWVDTVPATEVVCSDGTVAL